MRVYVYELPKPVNRVLHGKLCVQKVTASADGMQVSGAAVKINGSFSRHIETCSTGVPLENIFHACAHLFCSSSSIAVSKLSHLHRKPFNSDERFSNAFRPDLPAKLLSKMFHPCSTTQQASHRCSSQFAGCWLTHGTPLELREPDVRAFKSLSTEHTSMSPSATPATQSEDLCCEVPRLPRKRRRRPRRQTQPKRATGAQPSTMSATPATQNARPCRQVPRLPRKVKIYVAKCHACHANGGGDHGAKPSPSAPPEPAQYDKCHVCHAECTSMSPSATPATQSENLCREVPRLPRRRRRRPRRQTQPKRTTGAQPSTMSATPATQNARPCRQVPRLPRKVKIYVAKCHACHANGGGDHGDKPSQARHRKQPNTISATSATQNARPCRCHTCHAK